MYKVILEAVIDSVKMIPWLIVIYAGIEYIEYKFGSRIREKVKAAGRAGPMLGASFGIVPQCGFSVISSALYTKRLITLGTLLAVYLSTSDEAVPVILAQPGKIKVVFPLLALKMVIAVLAGYSVDFIAGRIGRPVAESEICATSVGGHHHEAPSIDEGCCGHDCAMEKPNYREMIRRPLVHTLKVFVFILAVSVALNLIIYNIGVNNLGRVLLGHSVLQPVIVGLIGLIPNCAASVAITEVFLKGGISFGSTIAGLSASAGLGMLVLLKENHDLKDTLKIIGLLYGISAVAGIAIQYFYG